MIKKRTVVVRGKRYHLSTLFCTTSLSVFLDAGRTTTARNYGCDILLPLLSSFPKSSFFSLVCIIAISFAKEEISRSRFGRTNGVSLSGSFRLFRAEGRGLYLLLAALIIALCGCVPLRLIGRFF